MRKNAFQEIFNDEKYRGFSRGQFPEIVDIELTNNCNLNCKMCARQNMTRLRGLMSQDVFETMAIECVRHNAGMRLIGWGEPFLHPKIIDFCKYVKDLSSISPKTGDERQSLLHITTNGQLITEKQMQELVDMELDSIIFSFQGASKEGYEAMRIGAKYDNLERNILNLVKIRGDKEKPFIHVSSTMTFETKEEIGAFVDRWEKVVDSVEVGKTQPLEYPKGEYIYYRPCTEVFHKLSIKWDGQVSACCADTDNMLIVGTIKQNTLFEIWNNGHILNAIRTLLLNNKHRMLSLCKNCTGAYEQFL